MQEECRNDASQPRQPINDANTNSIPFSTQRSRIDVSALPSDPGERKQVSTATVERVFSSMKYIKNNLRNRISDEFLNDTVITYFEDDLFESVSNDDILHRFQNMKSRRGQLD